MLEWNRARIHSASCSIMWAICIMCMLNICYQPQKFQYLDKACFSHGDRVTVIFLLACFVFFPSWVRCHLGVSIWFVGVMPILTKLVLGACILLGSLFPLAMDWPFTFCKREMKTPREHKLRRTNPSKWPRKSFQLGNRTINLSPFHLCLVFLCLKITTNFGRPRQNIVAICNALLFRTGREDHKLFEIRSLYIST